MRVPDHDSLVATIQSKVQEALSKVSPDQAKLVAQNHGISHAMLYNISRWKPGYDQSFNFRKLTDAYGCACDILMEAPDT